MQNGMERRMVMMKKIKNDKAKYYVDDVQKVVICKDRFSCQFLCLYPSGWKIENKVVLPSPIHYSDEVYKNRSRDKFDAFCKYEYKNYTKVYLISGVKDAIFFHPCGDDKKAINPEDIVNGVHIVSKKNIREYLKYKDNYQEYKEYTI